MVSLALDISTGPPKEFQKRGPVLTEGERCCYFGLCSGSHHVLHLEVLDQVEVDEHADGGQRGFRVGQLEVAKAEVQKPQGLSGRHRGDL